MVEHENSEGFEVEHEGGEEQESELEVNIIDISDGEEIVDKLIQVDSRDGYLTLKDMLYVLHILIGAVVVDKSHPTLPRVLAALVATVNESAARQSRSALW